MKCSNCGLEGEGHFCSQCGTRYGGEAFSSIRTNRVRDPIHGFIQFSDKEKQIINWPEFQRLRNIRQLALTDYVYPGAKHTRFEHSLGVMELATRIFHRLHSKNKTIIEQTLADIELSPEKARQVLRLAALLHDIGHLPFSHGGESVLPTGIKHEDVSIAVIRYLAARIDSLFFEGASNLAALLIQKGVAIPPQLTFLKNILSGEIDADRMDYLLRDSYHCGVAYGNFDYTRLVVCFFSKSHQFQMELFSTLHYLHYSFTVYYQEPPSKEKIIQELAKIKRDRFKEYLVSSAYDALDEAGLFEWK